MEMVEECFSKAKDLVDFLLADNVLAPKSRFDLDNGASMDYIFRGQADKNWSLVPTAHRTLCSLKEHSPQHPSALEREQCSKGEYLGLHIHAELRAVFLFLSAADQVGIKTPLDYSLADVHNELMKNLFRTDAKIDCSQPFPDEKWLPSMALAQHNGVPTRLLDWSESPWVAAFFAAEQALISLKNEQEGEFSITCLSTALIKDCDDIQLVSCPKADNDFLKAQRGIFTLISTANQYFLEHNDWPSIENIIKLHFEKRKVTFAKYPWFRLCLPTSEAGNLMKLLFRMDIHKLSLMPSLKHAAEHEIYKQKLFFKTE